MSLGLVAYDDSEESDNGSDTETTLKGDQTLSESGKVNSSKIAEATSKENENHSPGDISDDELELIEDDGISSKLLLPESSVNLLNTDIDIRCLTSSNQKNGPVKITIPSLNEIDDEADPPSKKKLKPSQKGSGLFAILPQPKSALVPQSVTSKARVVNNKKQNIPPKTAPKAVKPTPKVPVKNNSSLITYEDSDEEGEPSGTVDFFSLDSKDDVIAAPVVIDLAHEEPSAAEQPIEPWTVDKSGNSYSEQSSWSTTTGLDASSSTTQQPVSEYPTSDFMSLSNSDLSLDQEAMQQLCGRRDRLRMQEQAINLIDVSGDAIMPDSREWLTKQLTEETVYRPSHKKKDCPTSQQKRKHQITYLAYQAKENEMELKNQWASNRLSRKQTQAKYGF